ncbi:hypothetical protein AB4059_01510 [Lysobacter sp. 2RAF19]
MSRKRSEPIHPNRVAPPADLPADLRAIWNREFSSVPIGHFAQSDVGAMIDLCRLIHETDRAHAIMLTNRSRDASTHWRACIAMCQSARRALRLLPHSRQSPRRAGLLSVGSTRDDGTAYDPPERGRHDWRQLFDARDNLTPLNGSKG